MGLANEVYDYETGHKSICVTRSHGHASFTDEWFANKVNLAVLTPPANRRLCISGVYWMTAANAGAAALDLLVSGTIVFRAYPTRAYHGGTTGMHIHGGLGEALTFNSTTGGNAFFLLVNYRIID